MSDIAPKERLQRVLSDRPVDRPPVICTGGMMNSAIVEVMNEGGPVLPGAHFWAEEMAKLAENIHRATGFENLGIPFCMTVEAEVLGSRVDFGSLACEPKIEKEFFASCDAVDIRNIKTIVEQGRLPAVIEAAQLLRRRNPDTPVIASLTGPVSTAASIVDPLTFLKELRTRPQSAHRVLDYVTSLLVEYAQRVVESGADIVCIGDPTATGEILGPKVFGDFAVYYLNRICDAVHDSGSQVIVHICGDMSRSRAQLAQIHADAISTDALVNLKQLKVDFPQINTMGNVSTSLLEFGDPAKVARTTERLVRDGIDIISPACGLSTSTGLQNINALTGAVKAATTAKGNA